MKLVIIESPFAGDVQRNLAYARAAMADCLKPSLVYRIKNTVTGTIYVGVTSQSIRKRISDHLSAAKRYDSPLYRAMRKYGVELFECGIVARFESFDAAKSEERRLIDLWGTHVSRGGYNVTLGGDGALGRPVSAATREKHRVAQTALMADPKHRLYLSECAKRQYTDEARERAAARRRGTTLSAEQKEKISAAGKGRIVSAETRAILSAQRIGKRRPEAVIAKIKEAAIGRRHSPESCRKMSLARSGVPKTKEHRLAMVEAWERRRAERGAVKGVSRHKGKWVAWSYGDGRNLYVGTFDTCEGAKAAVKSAEKKCAS